jgi:predicted HAD superfamily Cof-like phosphohydrolase
LKEQKMIELSPHEARVIEMMRGFGQRTPAAPTMPTAQERERCFRLLLEEVLEYGAAAGLSAVTHSGDGQTLVIEDLAIIGTDDEPSLVDMVDACADISVVNTCAFAAMGVRMTPVLEVVDENNLTKIATGTLDPVTGKFRKHPEHVAPDLASVVAAQESSQEGI